jgi:hypothetical protein
MFRKGIILSETDYRLLWGDFDEILRERIEELEEEERDELVKSRKKLEDWVKEQVIEMFDFVLEDHDAEEAVIFLKGKCHYVPDGEEFYYLSYREGMISAVVEELEEELRGGIKESVRRLRVR